MEGFFPVSYVEEIQSGGAAAAIAAARPVSDVIARLQQQCG